MVIIRNQCIYYILFVNISLWRFLWVLLLFKTCQMAIKLIPTENPSGSNPKLCYYRNVSFTSLCCDAPQTGTRGTAAAYLGCACTRDISVWLSQSPVPTELLWLLCLKRLCRDLWCTCPCAFLFPFVNHFSGYFQLVTTAYCCLEQAWHLPKAWSPLVFPCTLEERNKKFQVFYN